MNEIFMPNKTYIVLVIAIVLLVVLILIVLSTLKKMRDQQFQLTSTFLQKLKPTLGLERNLDIILNELGTIVDAPTFSFYIFNPANQQFTLKAVRQITSDAQIAPSYSGLLPYEKEKYIPPLSLTKASFPLKTMIMVEGEVPILTIPIKGEKGFIRVGPLNKVSHKKMKLLHEIGNLLQFPITNLLEDEELRRNYEVLETSSKAVKLINHLFIHEVEYIKLLVSNCNKALKPLKCFLMEVNQDSQNVSYSSSMGKKELDYLNSNQMIPRDFKRVFGNKAITLFHGADASLGELSNLSKVGEYVILVRFSMFEKEYYIWFSFVRDSADIERKRSQRIQTMFNGILKYISIKQSSRQVSVSYIDFLKNLAEMIDQLSPYTIGYSELMSRYSMAIAKRMALSEYQVRSIGLAAYLSNIGVIGLSDGLLNKEGKYSDQEFEEMKLHSEVGATIIESTIALKEVAQYVRYHHERMDGNGYPARLLGDQIPIGAQIIAVVQTFLAKIIGRSYRDPLPFDQALMTLRNASGSHLNEEIVNVFISWYDDRRVQKNGLNQALGNCWDLCCTPSMVCNQCPAYKNEGKNCWEYESNNCLAHGKSCNTCFVYTEYLGRVGQLVGKGG